MKPELKAKMVSEGFSAQAMGLVEHVLQRIEQDGSGEVTLFFNYTAWSFPPSVCIHWRSIDLDVNACGEFEFSYGSTGGETAHEVLDDAIGIEKMAGFVLEWEARHQEKEK